MESHQHSLADSKPKPAHSGHRSWRNNFWWRWFVGNTLISGTLALIWLVLRSGTNPSRFAYPCQQAAISMASLAFGGPLVAAVIASRRHLKSWFRRPARVVVGGVGLLVTVACWGYFLQAREYAEYTGPVLDPPPDYRAELFHVATCPEDPTGDRFLGLDNLLIKMGSGGLKFYQSPTESPVSGPDGILARDDVIVIKINYQWDQRGGTNTDVLRGLIRRIVDHPDIFAGEVIVCENAQFNSVQGFDYAQNNAQDQSLSPHDVVAAFQGEGHNVSHYDWTALRYTLVDEYSAGDMSDGYVVSAYDSDLHGRVSYPKFQSDAGTSISLKHGIWDPGIESYDRTHLKFINLPVLKSHHAVYGATLSVKHYMGVVTRELSTNSHNAIHYGIMGALLGEIQLADLNIIDAIWINANPNDGPWTSYSGATRRDELVAGQDPVALDIWAVKNILIPAFVDNGYSPPWPSPSADPDLPSSAFRQYLDNSMFQILAVGHEVTNDLQQINVLTGDGGAGDFDEDSDVDLHDFGEFSACFTGGGGGPVSPGCTRGDFDGDGDVDCDDWELFRFVWTGPGAPPDLLNCTAIGVEEDAPRIGTALGGAFPNPFGATTRISYTIGATGSVKLRVFDARGRIIRTLVDTDLGPGEHGAFWDGKDDRGHAVGSGVFTYQLEAPGFTGSDKIVILR